MERAKPLSTPLPLGNATLDSLPDGITAPGYDRAALTPGIVHIGLGNFHRAHQAWYLHRLVQTGAAQDWAIIGAGVRAYDAAMRERLLAQDCLTTLIELDPDHVSAEVTGAMIDYLPIEDGNAPLIDQLSETSIRIASLTITEGGYFTDAATGRIDLSHREVRHDAANPDQPRTVFGCLVAALSRRRAAGTGPFTVMSCDNLRGNGDITRDAVVTLARQSDADLADWIDSKVTFPNGMVDCIVPATGPAEIALASSLGLADAAPVTHENFRQWVIEDRFCAGRPALEEVGVTFTDDVHAYETMKIRVLNAGHQVLANIGELLGVETIAGCMQHPLIREFFGKVQRDQILPQVSAVPGMTPQAYLTLIERRFSNTAIVDTTRRVAFDGSSRHSGFVLPILRDRLEDGRDIDGLALVEALWARMCTGLREDGSTIAANDPHWEDLTRTADVARQTPQAWLAQRQIYGDLAGDAGFATRFGHWLDRLHKDGVVATVTDYVQG